MEKSALHPAEELAQPSPFFPCMVLPSSSKGTQGCSAPLRQLSVGATLIHWAAGERVLTVPFSTDDPLIQQAASLEE